MASCANNPLVPDTILANRLHVAVAWLRAEADAGRLPGVHAGRCPGRGSVTRWLFDAELIQGILLARARGECHPWDIARSRRQRVDGGGSDG